MKARSIFWFGLCYIVASSFSASIKLTRGSFTANAFVHKIPVQNLKSKRSRASLVSKPSEVRKIISPSLLYYARYDNLVSGVAEISIGSSIAVLWSEFAILATGCGPYDLPNWIERFTYQEVILASSFIIYKRIVDRKGLVRIGEEAYGSLNSFTNIQVQLAEWLSLIAVFGAFVAFSSQLVNGGQMDGLSGVDIATCSSINDFKALSK
mmetsp:Transcript_34958/g.42182  ORF Transcript_34958/g.42182 Transcript_34958/m.42182 type:complete len:209 (-) Transcript_34958:70-696(-)